MIFKRITTKYSKYSWTLPLFCIVFTVFCLISLPIEKHTIEAEVILAPKPFYFAPSVIEGVFVRDVFRTENDEIAIFFLKDYRNSIDLQVKFDKEFIPVQYNCYYSVCQGTFDQCTFQDFMAIVKVDETVGELVTLRIGVDGMEHSFKLIDVRPKDAYDHQLGVVLQPAYYLSDWQSLIQYFESWLAHGATKFYIYHYSWTKQVADVITFYQKKLGDGLEVLPWSTLPVREVDKGRFSMDPNTRMFNLVSEAAMNNALYRAKGSVKYIAMTDLDELMFVKDGNNLTELLEKLDEENPNSAQFSFDWMHSAVNIQLALLDKPEDVDFNYLKTVKMVTKRSLAPIYFTSRKVIHMPSKVELLDTHNTLRNKKVNGSESTFETTYVDRKVASILHIRRIFDAVETKNSSENMLSTLVEAMNTNYKTRIANTTFSEKQMSPWVYEYTETLMTLHDCRRVTNSQYRKIVRGGLTQCRSVRGCEQFLGGQEHFIYAQNSWTNLASQFDVLGDIFPVKI